jgi:hypothetical protein
MYICVPDWTAFSSTLALRRSVQITDPQADGFAPPQPGVGEREDQTLVLA